MVMCATTIINPGECQCGCGNPAPLAPRNRESGGWVKGEPIQFCRGHNTRGVAMLAPDRVPNAPLREVYQAAVARGVSPAELCRRSGMTRKNGTTPDIDRLRRCLGITPTRGKGELRMLRTMRADRARALLVAIEELTAFVCECGEVMSEAAELCGFCVAEREAVAA